MIDGVKINMGGKEYVVPPLNMKSVKKLLPVIEELNKATSPAESLPKAAEIVLAALVRNYPDMTMDQVEDILDMGNARAVLAAIMGQSGLVPTGEAKAVSEIPTGTISTAS